MGEVLPSRLMGQLQQAYPGLRLLNGYGSTENGGTHFLDCSQPDGPALRSGFSLVGRTIPGHTDVYILNSQKQLLGPGPLPFASTRHDLLYEMMTVPLGAASSDATKRWLPLVNQTCSA